MTANPGNEGLPALAEGRNALPPNCGRNAFSLDCAGNTLPPDCGRDAFSLDCAGNTLPPDCGRDALPPDCGGEAVAVGSSILEFPPRPDTPPGDVRAFNARTGEPVWPINNQPVPPSDVPGEKAAATQPIPARPAPFDRQGVSGDDLNDLTPELHAEARKIFDSLDSGPMYSPPTARGRLMLPGVAASWSGVAYEPSRGYLYVPSITLGMIVKVMPVGRDQKYWLGTVPTPAPFLSNS